MMGANHTRRPIGSTSGKYLRARFSSITTPPRVTPPAATLWISSIRKGPASQNPDAHRLEVARARRSSAWRSAVRPARGRDDRRAGRPDRPPRSPNRGRGSRARQSGRGAGPGPVRARAERTRGSGCGSGYFAWGRSIRITRALSGRNPRSAACKAIRLRISRTAPMNRINERLIWEMTRPPCRRRQLRPVPDCPDRSLKVGLTQASDNLQAGIAPKIRPINTDAPTAKNRTCQSTPTSFKRGISVGHKRTSALMVRSVKRRPSKPAPMLKRRLSVSICRMTTAS